VVVLRLSFVPRGRVVGLLATKGTPLRIAVDREKGKHSITLSPGSYDLSQLLPLPRFLVILTALYLRKRNSTRESKRKSKRENKEKKKAGGAVREGERERLWVREREKERHTRTHIHTHTHTRTRVRTRTRTSIHTFTHTVSHTDPHIQYHTQQDAQHTHTVSYATRCPTHAHARTCTHRHT